MSAANWRAADLLPRCVSGSAASAGAAGGRDGRAAEPLQEVAVAASFVHAADVRGVRPARGAASLRHPTPTYFKLNKLDNSNRSQIVLIYYM